MVIYRHGKIALRLILSDDIVVEVGFDLLGFWYLLQFELLFFLLLSLPVRHVFLHDMISLFGTVLADKTAETSD